MVVVVAVLGSAACGSDDAGGDDASVDSAATESVEPTPEVTAPAETASTEPSGSTPGTVAASPDTTAAASNGAVEDPCALLQGVDLDALLGEPVGPAEGELNDIADTCNAETVSEDSRGTLALSVSTNSAADNFVNLEELFGVDAEITGLGDQAFHSGPYVVVLSGDTLVNLQVLRDAAQGFAVPDPDMEAAAAQVLANLGS